ncbi:Mitochondrial RNA pseudouridine synthase RPUSD4, partial [Schistosoma japonicum]
DYFGIENDQKIEENKHHENRRKALLLSSENFIDEQYFGDSSKATTDDDKLFTVKNIDFKKNASEISVLESNTPYLDDLSEIDSQYFGANSNPLKHINSVMDSCNPSTISEPKIKAGKKSTLQPPTAITSKSNLDRKTSKQMHRQNDIFKLSDESNSCYDPHDDENNDAVEYGADAVKIVRQRTRLNLYTGTTLDVSSSKVESSNPEKLDSHGYRVPDEDLHKFHLLTEEEAATVLYKSIIEIRENVIIMNKPYGIASQPGADCKHNIVDLLPRIESMIRKRNHRASKVKEETVDELSTVHRLDKDSTGAMLIARNRDASLKLQEAFARRWIKKDYLCITVGIPRSEYGYIQLPLVERNFKEFHKMCIPKLDRHLQELACKQTQLDENDETNEYDVTDAFSVLYNKMQTNNNNQPVTWYHLLDQRNDAGLMLCSTLTGIKHQVRAHLAFGLQTPVLGDHKYSHGEYLAPQRLPKHLLEALNVRQPKVRYLALHLHASSLHLRVSPSSSSSSCENFFDFVRSLENPLHTVTGSTRHPLKFHAQLPIHFRENLKRIGLKLPQYLKRLHW